MYIKTDAMAFFVTDGTYSVNSTTWVTISANDLANAATGTDAWSMATGETQTFIPSETATKSATVALSMLSDGRLRVYLNLGGNIVDFGLSAGEIPIFVRNQSGNLYFGCYSPAQGKVWTTAGKSINIDQLSIFDTPDISPPPTISGITIYAPDSVTCGFFVDITADVSGTGDYNTSATCTMSGASASATVLDDWGENHWRLFVSAKETAEEITVTVASVADPTITATKTITVKQSDDSGGDGGDSGGDGGGDSGGTGGDSGGGITPEGTLTITENGSYDVTEYASVEVNIPFPVADIKAAWWSGFATAAGLYGCGK